MNYRVTTLITASLLSSSVIAEEKIIDPQSGETIEIHTKSNRGAAQEVKEPVEKLCLDTQTLAGFNNDGTVNCYDTTTGSISSYLNIDIKSNQSATILKEPEIIRNANPCPKGSAIVNIDEGGHLECEPI